MRLSSAVPAAHAGAARRPRRRNLLLLAVWFVGTCIVWRALDSPSGFLAFMVCAAWPVFAVLAALGYLSFFISGFVLMFLGAPAELAVEVVLTLAGFNSNELRVPHTWCVGSHLITLDLVDETCGGERHPLFQR